MSKKKTAEEFIAKAREVHGDKYDYSKVVYINRRTKVCIICPIHGEFWQAPYTHLHGSECCECSYENRETRVCESKEWFVEKANIIHKNKYDYSKTVYNGASKKVLITCPIHGEFYQVAGTHLKGSGCPKCALGNRKMTTEDYVKLCRNVHGDKYDYSLVEYKNIHDRVTIICPKHGIFEIIANSHLRGQGCQKCCFDGRKHIVFGFGINDYEGRIIDDNGNAKTFYSVWHSMIRRCYSDNYKKIWKSYVGCSVCEEWRLLSNFKKWFDDNYKEGLHLDKDILVQDNKIYSPSTCCFVPQCINSLITDHRSARGPLKLGVVKSGNKFSSSVNYLGNSYHIGTFDTEDDAHKAYVSAKKEAIRETAKKALIEGLINEKIYNALINRKIKEY